MKPPVKIKPESYLLITAGDAQQYEGLAGTAHVLLQSYRSVIQQPCLTKNLRLTQEAIAMMRDQLDTIDEQIRKLLESN